MSSPSDSFADLVDQFEYLIKIGRQDQESPESRDAKVAMRATRNATRETRKKVAATTRAVAAHTAEQRAVRDRLAWSQRELASARPQAGNPRRRARTRSRPRPSRAAGGERFARGPDPRRPGRRGRPSPDRHGLGRGLVWPVNGVFTSGFGWRWGRMHEGIDIACPTGTPVVACGRRHRHRRRLDGRLRQPRRRRPRRRRRHGVRAQPRLRGRRGAEASGRAR